MLNQKKFTLTTIFGSVNTNNILDTFIQWSIIKRQISEKIYMCGKNR